MSLSPARVGRNRIIFGVILISEREDLSPLLCPMIETSFNDSAVSILISSVVSPDTVNISLNFL
ncbi:MAG TPA: hypothetical protein DC042_09150 [Bacteroidales bacterium]|nr:hypothetical protein [Bacteroidales bacterium]